VSSIRPVAGQTHTKRGAGPGEIAIYQVLASLAPACNDTLTTLLLPAAITIEPARRLLVLPHYDGEDLGARYLIVQPTGRIVVIDWETYNPNSPFHTVDHPENVAAVFYAHMWGNPAWQAAYRDALRQRLGFSPAGFAKGVLIAALELANMWMNDTDLHLATIQASTITNVLSQAPGT
jgi:hypothetical protein